MEKTRLLRVSMFVIIDEKTLTPKNGGNKTFPMKQKRKCHLSQWGECAYGAQPWKEVVYCVHLCLSQLKDELEF